MKTSGPPSVAIDASISAGLCYKVVMTHAVADRVYVITGVTGMAGAAVRRFTALGAKVHVVARKEFERSCRSQSRDLRGVGGALTTAREPGSDED